MEYLNWLFRRISSRKDRSGGSGDKTMHSKRSNQNASGIITERRLSSGSIQRRKSRRQSKKLQRDPKRQPKRAYSFSPGRETIQANRPPPVPKLPDLYAPDVNNATSGRLNNTGTRPIDSESTQRNRAASRAQLEGQNWERVPTLHKRPGQELNRRKSSKKRKEEHDREAEIRAMSAIMPLKKQPVRMRSEVSLPPAASIKSSRSNDERHTSYKIAALDIISPHPTIRYAENPRYGRTMSSDNARRNRVSDRMKGSEDLLKSHKRVDDLVEEMDASELREIMERDKRRREKKRIEDQMKMERRLARRKARQEAEQAAAAQNGTVSPKNMDRGIIGRELEGKATSEAPDVKRSDSTGSQRRRGKRPAETEDIKEPSIVDELIPAEPAGEPTAVIFPPMSPKLDQQPALNATQSMELDTVLTTAPSDKSTKASRDRQESESNVRHHQSWTSFFRRTKNRRVSTDTPSSFSNTSRDSIPARAELPTQMPPLPLVRQVSSGVPKRTKSKFREDLPELPISPPDSRNQSPEVDVVPPMHSNYPEKLPAARGSSDSPYSDPSGRRYDTPTSGLVSGHRSIEAPSPEPAAILSQSLASVGSEGSWLSGKAGGLGSKRGSSTVPPHPLRDSASSLQKRYRDYTDSAEELGIAEDEYFSRLTPGLEEDFKTPEKDDRLPSSDDEDDGSIASPTKWHGAVGRQPQVIYHDTRVVKSREGLLHEYLNEDAEAAPVTPQEADQKRFSFLNDRDPNAPDSPEAVIGRATSLEITRGPVRQVSNASGRSKRTVESSG